MYTIEQIFQSKSVVPALNVDDIELAKATTEALVKGGARIVVVRLTNKKALKIISALKESFPQLIIGAGRIMDAADYLNACLAGAEFISSPGTSSEIYTAARTRYTNAHYVPGVVTPSDVMQALSQGFHVMHLFPVREMVGYELAKTYAHTFPEAKFVMSGGITLDNAENLLALPNVHGVGVSEITQSQLIVERNFAEIQRRMERALQISKTMQNKG